MSERINKNMARNIYFGGGLFAILVFAGLSVDTVQKVPKLSNADKITESVARGKNLWETNNCVGCHTIMGEGAYYAPELANVFDRRGASDEASFKEYLNGWMAAQPLSEPGRRKMPQFNLTQTQVNDLADFLIWTSRIDDNEWPPNIEG
ncbi:c-type cytochrome [Sulfurimonas aquatica]|uniref:C-type cytochrome n=1 Tax=Sulfurimonas aquatica TaxID=2672570 RepID=A0A975B225_9BACT|nr:cytochrome c [Sulfurimonas aquatica]QSZ42799.1 c-type cytochrome [Sulfurimonas aquatica]